MPDRLHPIGRTGSRKRPRRNLPEPARDTYEQLPSAPVDDLALAREFLLTWFVYAASELADAKRLMRPMDHLVRVLRSASDTNADSAAEDRRTRSVGGALQRAADVLITTRTANVLRYTKIVDGMVDDNLGWVPYTQLANITGRPAISLPLYWTADGLPLGVQFVATSAGESLLIRLAAQLELALPWSDCLAPALTFAFGNTRSVPLADSGNATLGEQETHMPEVDDFNEMNRKVISEFRETGGKAGGIFEGKPLVLVHHTGAKSGTERIAPLVPLLDGDRIFIFASKGGADTNPDWFHNLVANPATTVEFGADTFPVTARVLAGQERDDVYAKQAEAEPQFGDYQRNTTRVIPVFELARA